MFQRNMQTKKTPDRGIHTFVGTVFSPAVYVTNRKDIPFVFCKTKGECCMDSMECTRLIITGKNMPVLSRLHSFVMSSSAICTVLVAAPLRT